MKTLLLGVCFFCIVKITFSQHHLVEPTEQNALKIGSRFPDVLVSNVINNDQSSVRLSAIHRKLIILDFWSTHCATCIEAFPTLDSLQHRFNDKLKIVGVSYESKKIIADFLIRRKKLTGAEVHFTIACGDTLLEKIVRPTSYPHCVWLNDQLEVLYITYGDAINNANITSVITGKKKSLREKREFESHYFDGLEPLTSIDSAKNKAWMNEYTVFGKYRPDLNQTTDYFSRDSFYSSLVAVNLPIETLYAMAYFDGPSYWFIPQNRTILEVRDTLPYVWYNQGVMQVDQFYCYQHICRKTSEGDMKRRMQSDLRQMFLLDARLETRDTDCWVLTAEDTTLISTKGGDMLGEHLGAEYKLIFRNLPIEDLNLQFTYGLLADIPQPFINETGIKGHFDMILDDIIENDPTSFQHALRKYKMHLNLRRRKIAYLILSETPESRHLLVSRSGMMPAPDYKSLGSDQTPR